jgi:hypothetical protein
MDTDIDDLIIQMNTTMVKENNKFEEFDELCITNNMLENILNNPQFCNYEYVYNILFKLMRKYLMFVSKCNECDKALFFHNSVYIELEKNIRDINFSDYNSMVFDCYKITSKLIEIVDEPRSNAGCSDNSCSDISCSDTGYDSQMDL